MSRISWIGRTGEAAAWVISALAWSVSFAAQVSLALAHGFMLWEALAWGMTTDIAGLVGMLLALDQARRNASTRAPWVIAIASAGVMVAANVGSAVGDVVAMLLHAWPPFIALASWYVLVHVRRTPKETAPTTSAETVAMPTEDVRQTRRASQKRDTNNVAAGSGGPERNPLRPRLPARVQVRRLLKRHGMDLDTATVAIRTGVSKRHAARLLREERQPHVVGDTSPQIKARGQD